MKLPFLSAMSHHLLAKPVFCSFFILLLAISSFLLSSLFVPSTCASFFKAGTPLAPGEGTHLPPVFRHSSSSRYSSFECIAGNQNFDYPLSSWHFGPRADEPNSSVCLLRNVCLLRKPQANSQVEIVYYQNPAVEGATDASFRLDSGFPKGKTFLGLITWLNGIKFSPRVTNLSLPSSLSFAPEGRFYVLDDMSDPSNYWPLAHGLGFGTLCCRRRVGG